MTTLSVSGPEFQVRDSLKWEEVHLKCRVKTTRVISCAHSIITDEKSEAEELLYIWSSWEKESAFLSHPWNRS